PGFETHRRAGGDVEATAARHGAVEREGLVGLREMVVRADLDRAIAGIGDRYRGGGPAGVELDVARRGDDFAGSHGSSYTTAKATPATATSPPAPRTSNRPLVLPAPWATPMPIACSTAVAAAKPAA